jgi:hypothetical protein
MLDEALHQQCTMLFQSSTPRTIKLHCCPALDMQQPAVKPLSLSFVVWSFHQMCGSYEHLAGSSWSRLNTSGDACPL